MTRQHPEDDFHVTVAQFLDLALPEDACWTTVEHGGQRGKAEAGRLKAKGLKPGWPDIQIVYRGRSINIELKAKGGTLSKAQKAMHARLTRAGAFPFTVMDLPALEGYLRGHDIPLRASTGARQPREAA